MGRDFDSKSDELLSAFDKVSNSNSFLLKAPRMAGDLRRRFLSFAPSEEFEHELRRADSVREWDNYRGMNSKGEWIPSPGKFCNGKPIEFAEVLTVEKFADRLQWLLLSGPCFYGHRYPVTEVSRISEEFLREFQPDRDEVLSVRPDFLFSHRHLEAVQDLPEKALCYFDGVGCDHCWIWLNNSDLLVLLLNGTS